MFYCLIVSTANVCFFETDSEAELQQAHISEFWSLRGSGQTCPSPSGSQPYKLYRAILLFWSDLSETPTPGREPAESDPSSYLHNHLGTRKLLDLWTQVRNDGHLSI